LKESGHDLWNVTECGWRARKVLVGERDEGMLREDQCGSINVRETGNKKKRERELQDERKKSFFEGDVSHFPGWGHIELVIWSSIIYDMFCPEKIVLVIKDSTLISKLGHMILKILSKLSQRSNVSNCFVNSKLVHGTIVSSNEETMI